MKEFTSKISICLVDTLCASFEFLADHFDFTPAVMDDEGGISWNCDKTLVIDTPSEDTLRLFRVPRKAIVSLKASDRTVLNLGTKEIPARVHIVEHLQKSQLIIRCTMVTAPEFIPEWSVDIPSL